MNRLTSLLTAVSLLSIGLTANAKQDTLTVDKMASNAPDCTLKYSYYGNALQTEAGYFTASLNGGTPFDAYCVDLKQTVNPKVTYDVTVKPLSAYPDAGSYTDTGNRIAWLYNTYSAGAHNDVTKAAALQMAIWEVAYEASPNNDYSLTDGNFVITKGIYNWMSFNQIGNYAEADLTGLKSAISSKSVGNSNANWYYSADKQDLIGPAVPEPGSLALMGSSFLGLGTMFIRRRRA